MYNIIDILSFVIIEYLSF